MAAAGRQGDPGESRFYLSLDDELMRLFATGALSYVMGRALPDDEAIEAKMVTKAIERAQTTVETKNAEIRKNVLKYDEVMNEQRKVIYKRRDQILDGEDLRSAAMEYLADAVDALIDDALRLGDADDEWDLDGLAKELTHVLAELDHRGRSCAAAATPTRSTTSSWPTPPRTTSGARQELGDDVMRQVERQVMLRIIDQRWREHLEEMDYLQEGINLRAMGQKDPLTEWQREGFEMFGGMMKGIAQDFVKYVMHVQVVQNQGRRPTTHRPCRTCRQIVVATTSRSSGFDQAAARAAAAEGDAARQRRRRAGRRRPSSRPSSRTTGRQDAAQRAVPVRFGQEVQAVPRRCLIAFAMRDFTDDLRDAAAPPRRGRDATCRSPTTVNGSPSSRSRSSDPTCGTTRTGPRSSTPSTPTSGRPRRRSTGSREQLDDVEVLHELAREEDDESQEPEIEAAIGVDRRARSISSSCAACSPASTTTATASCRSTRRTAASTPRTGAEMLLRMYERWASVAGFTHRARTTCPRAPRPASCRPSSRSPAATPTG